MAVDNPTVGSRVSFPELEGPSIFLASPGDVAYLRDVVSAELASLKQQVADDHGIELYAWEIDKAQDGFEDDLPAQIQIPVPAGPRCRAVICLFGEKIGTPLPKDFPLGPIESLNARDEGLAYRLVHPWKPEAANQGGFPLTGTTFEYLSTLAASSRAGTLKHGEPIPLFLRFVGDASILDPQTGVGKKNWGCRRLRDEARARFKDDDDALALWIASHQSQLKQLQNFVLFVQSLGIVIRIVGNAEEARTEVRNFLIEKLDLRIVETDRDPFKGLEVYDVGDSTVFFGRSAERAETIESFLKLWDDQDKPNSFGVIGGSGVGKSSFLRAGIIARLAGDKSRGSFLDCVIRPSDLLPPQVLQEASETGEISFQLTLQRLYQRAAKRIARENSSPLDPSTISAKAAADFTMVDPAHGPAWVVQRLSELLADLGPGFKLLFGFDQFEEIVDQRGDPVAGPFWCPVVDFIAAAVLSERIGILYTLQANRVGLIAEDPILASVWASGGQTALAFPEQSIQEIIRRPFELTRAIRIAPEMVRSLSERITAFKNTASSGAVQGSLLPLVSLTLRRIYEKRALPLLADLLASHRSQAHETSVAVGPGFADAASDLDTPEPAERTPAFVLLTTENCADLLNVEDAIAELADEAMQEAKAASGPEWSETTLGDLFRRLVEVRGEQYGLLEAAVPKATAPHRLAVELKQRRLLLPAEANRVRLVHEAVLNHWKEAQKWLKTERPLLSDAAKLQDNALQWEKEENRSVEFLQGFGPNDVDRAATVLAQWWDILTDQLVLANSESKRLMRDYSLELLYAHPTPSQIVERSLRKPSHLMIAVSYERADIVRDFLAQDPESVHLARMDKRTAIFFPCFTGADEILDLLLAQGAKVDEPDVDGWRPAHMAAAGGHLRCLSRLLDKGATLEPSGTPGGSSLLHIAARKGHTEMLTFLLTKCGIASSITDAQGWTPLHVSAHLDQTESIRVLATSDAKLEAVLDYGWTPLHLAAEGHPASVSALLEAKANPMSRLANEWTPLHLASRGNHAAVARELLQHGADPRAHAINEWSQKDQLKRLIEVRPGEGYLQSFDWEPLHIAADHGSPDVVQVLLEGGADPRALTGEAETALHLAAHKGHLAIIAPLLAADPQVTEIRNRKGETPLHVALHGEQPQFAAELVSRGASVDTVLTQTGNRRKDGWTALHEAGWEGNVARVAFLLKLGANPNAENTERQTPLHLAAAHGAEGVVELLQNGGADPAVKGTDGTTPLHLACLGGHAAVVERLVALTLATDLPAEGGVTPLHLAARRGAREVVQLLLERKHPVDSTDREGWTPLHLAAQGGSIEIVDLLLGSGADPNRLAARPAMTPLQAAAEVGHMEIVKALLGAGADSTIATAARGKAIALAVKHGHDATALLLVEHGDSLSDTDPISGRSLIDLYLEVRQHRVKADTALSDADGLLLQRFRQAGIDVPDTADRPADVTLGLSSPSPAPRSKESRQLGNFLSYPWTAVSREETEPLLERVNPVDGKFTLELATTLAERCGLSWYDGLELYRLSDPSSLPENLFLCYLITRTGDFLFRLNGTAPPIHEVNAKAPIKLNPDNVLDYLRFFCFFVRGEEGPFYVAEDPGDPMLPVDLEIRRMLAETIRPASFEGLDDEGRFVCNATIYYSNAVFGADFIVSPSGMIEMRDDEPIAADLPGKIETRLA